MSRRLRIVTLVVAAAVAAAGGLGSEPSAAPTAPGRYATTAFMEPDRCAVAWAIKRHIDPQATFEFYDRDAFPPGVTTFDLPDSAIKRDARRSALEVLLDRHELDSSFLRKLRLLIHSVEIAPWSSRRPRESHMFERIMVDALTDQADSTKALTHCFSLLDTLEELEGDVGSWAEIWQDSDGAIRMITPSMYHIDRPGLANVIRISERIYSGGEPDGREGFDSLARLGVQTIVSVDGARPPVALARARGIRYVHVPIGYDSVPPEASKSFRRIVDETDGKIYVHCHHGKHRGPAAAAIFFRLDEGAPIEPAVEVMRLAGTNPGYSGLWRSVEEFDASLLTGEAPELHEIAPVGSFATAMAGIDRIWDRLKLGRLSDWKPLKEHPDIDLKHEALMLKEAFVELRRLEPEGRAPELLRMLDETVAEADLLRQALELGATDRANSAQLAIGRTCSRCHEAFRNSP